MWLSGKTPLSSHRDLFILELGKQAAFIATNSNLPRFLFQDGERYHTWVWLVEAKYCIILHSTGKKKKQKTARSRNDAKQQKIKYKKTPNQNLFYVDAGEG